MLAVERLNVILIMLNHVSLAFNAVYARVGRLASEEVVLGLLRSKCLPILLYATEACPLLSRNKQSLEFTGIYRRPAPLRLLRVRRRLQMSRLNSTQLEFS